MLKNAIRLAVVGVVANASIAAGQYSLTGSPYHQNFDALPQSVSITVAGGNLNSHSTDLKGWYFLESGTNANDTLTAGNGSSNTGDTYSFGSGVDRALGSLLSSTLTPKFGFYMSNQTGGAIASISISYTGETWRVGTANRSDRLDF